MAPREGLNLALPTPQCTSRSHPRTALGEVQMLMVSPPVVEPPGLQSPTGPQGASLVPQATPRCGVAAALGKIRT